MRVVNDKARFDYEVLERIEAGIVLNGAEVKSAKRGGVEMAGAHCKVMPTRFGSREIWVFNMNIFPYKHADSSNYDSRRKRKLLLHQREIVAIESRMRQARLVLIPTAVYIKDGLVKMEVGLARGKRKYEKREEIKKREMERGWG